MPMRINQAQAQAQETTETTTNATATADATTTATATGITKPGNPPATILWAALAFLVKDFRDETSYRFNFFWQMIAPLSGVLSLYFLARLIGPATSNGLDPSGSTYFAFAVVGIVTLGLLTKTLTGFGTSLRQQMMLGTMEAIMATSLNPAWSISMLGIWKIVLALATGLLQLLVAMLLGANIGPINPAHLVLAISLIIAAFTGLGMLVAGSVLFISRAQPAITLLGGLSGLLGGVVYPVTVLPPFLAYIAGFLPITPAINILRSVLLPQSLSNPITGSTSVSFFAISGMAGSDLFTQSAIHLLLFALLLIPSGIVCIHLGLRYRKKRGLLVTY